MTRKDYILLAKAIGGSRFVVQPNKYQWLTTVDAVGDALAKDNPRFDRGRFVAAVADAARGK